MAKSVSGSIVIYNLHPERIVLIVISKQPISKICGKNHNIGRNIDDLKSLNKLRLENVAEIPNIGRFRNMARNMGPYIGYFL